jgi:3-mercaptopyruvate sulfurtransferase SseA
MRHLPQPVPVLTQLRLITSDLSVAAVLTFAALGLGITVNAFRTDGLPLIYETPEIRLTRLITQTRETLFENATPVLETPSTPTFTELTLAETRAILAAQSAVFVDARPESIWREGHIPGSVPLGSEEFTRLYPRTKTQLNRPLVVYCSSAHCGQSRLIATVLHRLGHLNIRIFPGGWEEWSAAAAPIEPSLQTSPDGLPITRSENPPTPGRSETLPADAMTDDSFHFPPTKP